MKYEDGEIEDPRGGPAEDELPPIARELMRIFGNPTSGELSQGFTIVPLVSEAEAVAFLQSVPAGTSWTELSTLAAAFRAAHPNPSVADDDDFV
jgi:hypothetical protein